MASTREYLPKEWEERWRSDKERRKMAMEEGGEKAEEANQRLRWIKAYNDKRLGIKKEMVNSSTKRERDEVSNGEHETQRFSQDNYSSEFFHAMAELWQCAILTDLRLCIVNGMTFQAHSVVVAAVSSLVYKGLQQWNKNKEGCIFVSVNPKVSSLGIAAILEFAYTGQITGLNKRSLAQIRTAAHHLEVPQVLDLCKEEEKKKSINETRTEDEMKSAEERLTVNLQFIRQLWKKGIGCDVELEAEGEVFCAHRIVLSATNDYFHAMFLSGMKESQQASVSLLLMGALELETLLQYCYSGDIFLAWNCIFEMTSAALQFQFLSVSSLCISYLEKQISIKNCLDVVAFADAYMLGDLFDIAKDFALVHFQDVVKTPRFLELPAEKLLDLIKHDALCVPSELAVFRAAASWIEANPVERLSQAQKVMNGVRFPLMTFREFCEVRAVNLQMECSGQEEVFLYSSALKEFGFGGHSPEVRYRVRYPKDVIITVGGDQLNPDTGKRLPSKQLWFANSLSSGTGLVKNMEWKKLSEMPKNARFRHGVGVLKGKLYVAGGCHYYSKADTMKSVYRYDSSKNLWERLSDMHENRSNFTIVVRKDNLYAIGGDKDTSTNLDSVEKYSPDTNTWSFSHPLDQPMSGYAAVELRGEIFISGGFNCKYQCLVSMFLYHPEQGTTYLADMTHDRAQHCMETLAEHIFVAGGMCNLEKFYTDQLSCESYDPVSDAWTSFTSLPLSHIGGASAVLEEKFYVLGGYCQEDYNEVRLVHRFDPETQKWDNMGTLSGPVTDIRACLLHLPESLRK